MKTCFELSSISKNNIFRQDDYWTWCPSVCQGADGLWHMFASRWPKSIQFHPGWLTNSEIIRAVSDKPEGPYRFAEVVFPARGAEYWDGVSTHNPTIRVHGGKYYLFYTGITYPFEAPRAGEILAGNDPRVVVARSAKRIGVAIADRPEGPWKRFDHPAMPTIPHTYYSFLTSNAAPWIEDDGSVKMIFKSRQYEGGKHGRMNLGFAQAKSPLGPYEVSEKPIFEPECEDPFFWKQDGTYYLITKDMHARMTEKEGAVVLLTSPDGIHFDTSKAMTVCSKELKWDNGAVRKYGHTERPFLLLQKGVPTHLCLAVADCDYGFQNMKDSWNVVVPIASSQL